MELRLLFEGTHRTGQSRLARRTHEASRGRRSGIHSPAARSAAVTAKPDVLMTAKTSSAGWPALPFEEWADTCATLHLWTQVVGKIRLACAPWVNHWWHVPLYVTATGLTTSVMPYGAPSFEIVFDFC